MLHRFRKPPLKKSEKIEVRLSFEDKQALQARAEEEGETVSEVVRDLIQAYLSTPTRAQASIRIRKAQAMFIHTLSENPRKATAALFTALGVSLTALPLATADPIKIELEGKVESASGVPLNDRSFSSTVSVEPGAGNTVIVQSPGSRQQIYTVDVAATPTGGEEVTIEYMLDQAIKDGDVDGQPSASLGEDGETMQLTATIG